MSHSRIPIRWLAAGAALLTLSGGGYAVAAGEGKPLLGGARNPGANQTRELTRETEIIANTSEYGTRQSNKSDNGGGAIYGCRSLEGGTPANREPCIRANNLSRGLAFEFESDGTVAGTITAVGGDNARPFTTNATGVATGLNADRVDGKNAEDLQKDALAQYQGQVRFASVAANGDAGDRRGVTAVARESAGTYRVDFQGNVNNCSQQVTPRATDARTATVEEVDQDSIRVRTFDVTAPAAPADTPFHVTVSC